MDGNTLAIIGLIVAAITAIGVFLGPRLTAKWQRKQERQDTSLKAHFEDLKNEAQSKISTMTSALYEWQRKINVYDSSAPPSGTELSEFSNSFDAHFSEEAKDYSKYKQKMIKHNKKYEQFHLTVENDFASKGILKARTSTSPFTCIYDITFLALFRWWEDLTKNDPHPQPDFTQIELKQAKQGYYLYASGLGASPVAYAENDPAKDKLERVLLEIAQNDEYKGETAKLLNSYKSLSQELKTYWSRLNEKLESIGKFEIGKRFKKLKTCSTCKKIKKE